MNASKLILPLLLLLPLSGCFTGVEGTKKVTDKDVKRALSTGSETTAGSALIDIAPRDSVASWPVGKRFYVCDDQARLLFAPNPDYSIDTLHLAGKYLSYKSYKTGSLLDNNSLVTLIFTDGRHDYSYRTGKTLAELHRGYTIPFFIDNDVVQHAASQIQGKTFYVKTRIWYDPRSGEMKDGRQFIPVTITQVEPGNKVYALKITFRAQDTGEQAVLWVADDNRAMRARAFDAQFTATDLRKTYSHINDDVWNHIVHGTVQPDMTKEECRLSMGAPKSVNTRPDQNGLKEYWYYDGGIYLYFEDGLLKNFRR